LHSKIVSKRFSYLPFIEGHAYCDVLEGAPLMVYSCDVRSTRITSTQIDVVDIIGSVAL
jgi:hypothetical protein